jgi:HAD superfamily hydrolase (TIGR01509 family)
VESQIKACLFDLGNVLLNFTHEQMFTQIADCFGSDPEQVKLVLLEGGLQARMDAGATDAAQFQLELETGLGGQVERQALLAAYSQIFTLNEAMPPLLEQLRDQGVRLILVSNTCDPHFAHIVQEFDLLDRFDGFALSYQVGSLKPAAAIYDHAVALADVPASSCFFTDDLAANVIGARAQGIAAEVFLGAPVLVEQLSARGIQLQLPDESNPDGS